ncbi:hypothetical protein Moror_9376 [Moniliophthora roreri MCA 2997]|uniref:Uncharacterized protein n=1 Tax=Moniliophthora roreri (strain MCA 2997) TaxID=1381753 RepID=V2WWV7_MONRO|nr:hypothetical protein Moror_9376 [Moniliophthora roreri MCA 2997]
MPPDSPPMLYKQPRQLTSSSSFNWWPYPPWGASSTSTPIAVPVTIITTTIQEVPTPTPVPETSLVVVSSSPLPSSPSSPSQPSVHNSSGLDSSSSPASSSVPPSSNVIISITPLNVSPSATPSFIEYPKNSVNSNSNEKINMILIPVFVVVGVLLGSVVAWFGYGCITRKAHRKKNRKRTELEVGPEYSYSPSLKDESEKMALSTVDLHGLGQDHTWRGLDYTEERNSLLVPGLPHSAQNYFLSPVPRDASNKSLSRAATSKTATSVSIYSQVDLENADEDIDPRSPRISQKKSKKKQSLNTIRRFPTTATSTTTTSTNTRIESLSRRRPTYTRDDTSSSPHAELSRNGTARTCATTTTTGTSKGTGDRDFRRPDLSRATTARTTTTTRTGAETSMGFRIVDETPLQSPTGGFASPNTGFSWVGVGELIWQRRGTEEVDKDKYTSLPKSPARSKRSTGSRKNTAEERDQKLREYYGYGLPKSPPQVTTPRLEGELCFTPLIGQGRGK